MRGLGGKRRREDTTRRDEGDIGGRGILRVREIRRRAKGTGEGGDIEGNEEDKLCHIL